MLNKTVFLATILLFTLGTSVGTLQSKPLNTTQIEALIDNGLYLSTERWRVRPRYIKIPSQFKLGRATQCYQTQLEHFLETQLLGQAIKINFDKEYKSTQLYRTGTIKFAEKYDLAEFFLKHGWARIQTDTVDTKAPKNYLQAQNLAQNNRLGLWGECDNWYSLRETERLKGHSHYFPNSHKQYLASNTMGWVEKVLTPNTIVLDSGQKIQLQGIALPNDNTPLSLCWSDWVRKALTKQLIGKKIELEYDHLELTSQGQRLQRYVWLKEVHSQNQKLLNALMVREGWALLDRDQLNLKNITLMNEAEQAFIAKTKPPEWWLQCAPIIMTENQTLQAEAEKLVYDENCPIKGNISGSKKSPKKTFHTPLSGWYKRIEVEQCFKSEDEALKAGFIKVK